MSASKTEEVKGEEAAPAKHVVLASASAMAASAADREIADVSVIAHAEDGNKAAAPAAPAPQPQQASKPYSPLVAALNASLFTSAPPESNSASSRNPLLFGAGQRVGGGRPLLSEADVVRKAQIEEHIRSWRHRFAVESGREPTAEDANRDRVISGLIADLDVLNM